MWKKYLALAVCFLFFAILQGSFFAHFLIWGAKPNLVFALFFVIIFFAERQYFLNAVVFSVFAGFLLDIFSLVFIGSSIVLLLCIAGILALIRSWLKNFQEKRPFIHFLPLFIVLHLVYDVLFSIIFSFSSTGEIFHFSFSATVGSLFYTAIAASILFFVWRKIIAVNFNSHQLKLFK